MFSQSVKQFVSDAYQLISANSPTVPLYGDDNNKGIQFLNELILSYSGTGLFTTIARQIDFILPIGAQYITFCDSTYPGLPVPPPTPPSQFPAVVVTTGGRLSNLQNAWLFLDGVTYPLVDESRNIFYASYKFDPQQGLPRFCIITNNVDYTTMRVYPSASQQYTISVYGKFQLPILNQNSNMSEVPQYYYRFLKFALAKDLAFYKGRASAWTDRLETELQKQEQDIVAISPVNLTITSEHDSLLNGSWRVRAGI